MMEYGEKIYQLRRDNKYSQEQLAELLGVARQTISRWELGISVPTFNNIVSLAKLFNVTINYFNEEEVIKEQANDDSTAYQKINRNIKLILKQNLISMMLFSLLCLAFIILVDYVIFHIESFRFVENKAILYYVSSDLIIIGYSIILLINTIYLIHTIKQIFSVPYRFNVMFNTSVLIQIFKYIRWQLIIYFNLILFIPYYRFVGLFILIYTVPCATALAISFEKVGIYFIKNILLRKKKIQIETNIKIKKLNIFFVAGAIINLGLYLIMLFMVFFVYQSYVYVYDFILALFVFFLLSCILLISYYFIKRKIEKNN